MKAVSAKRRYPPLTITLEYDHEILALKHILIHFPGHIFPEGSLEDNFQTSLYSVVDNHICKNGGHPPPKE